MASSLAKINSLSLTKNSSLKNSPISESLKRPEIIRPTSKTTTKTVSTSNKVKSYIEQEEFTPHKLEDGKLKVLCGKHKNEIIGTFYQFLNINNNTKSEEKYNKNGSLILVWNSSPIFPDFQSFSSFFKQIKDSISKITIDNTIPIGQGIKFTINDKTGFSEFRFTNVLTAIGNLLHENFYYPKDSFPAFAFSDLETLKAIKRETSPPVSPSNKVEIKDDKPKPSKDTIIINHFGVSGQQVISRIIDLPVIGNLVTFNLNPYIIIWVTKKYPHDKFIMYQPDIEEYRTVTLQRNKFKDHYTGVKVFLKDEKYPGDITKYLHMALSSKQRKNWKTIYYNMTLSDRSLEESLNYFKGKVTDLHQTFIRNTWYNIQANKIVFEELQSPDMETLLENVSKRITEELDEKYVKHYQNIAKIEYLRMSNF